MGKTWRKERYESDENSNRSFAKSQKRHWVDQEIIEEVGYFDRELFDNPLSNLKTNTAIS